MTNPITEPTQSIRERQAQAVALKFWPSYEWQDCADWQRDSAFDAVDASNAEIQGPSKGMLDAATAHHKFIGHPEAKQSSIDRQLNGHRLAADDYWRSMIRHIRSGGK